jgi:hypothetical protein
VLVSSPNYRKKIGAKRAGRVLAMLVCVSWPSPGGSQQLEKVSIEDHAKAVRELVESAASLPVEFRADIQLQAVESGALGPGKLSADTLQRLIESAGYAKNPYPLARVFLTGDSVENRLADATQTLIHVDTLSIRERAIAALAKMDREKALRALREVRVEIPETSCAAAVIPDVAGYYGGLDKLAAVVFSAADKAKNEDISWYEDNVRGMGSPLQLVAMADLLLRVSASSAKEQFERLSTRYVSVLQTMRATDRELAWLEADGKLTKAVVALAARRKELKLSADMLMISYREFLMRSSEEVPCGDLTTNWKAILATFNEAREDLKLGERIPGLKSEELQRKNSRGERAQVQMMPYLKEFNRVFEKIYALRAKDSSQESPEEKAVDTEGWESDFAEALRELDGYDPSRSDCTECAHIEKTELLMGMLDLCPDDVYKRKVLKRLVSLLGSSPLQTEAPMEWLFQVKLLLDLGRAPSAEQLREIQSIHDTGRVLTMLPNSLGKEIGEEMKRSGDFTMYLYVHADEILGGKYYSPYLN